MPGDDAALMRLAQPLQRVAQRGDVFGNVVALAGVSLADRLQHLEKPRPPPALLRREIGPAPKRLAVGGQKHRQWPAALLAHQRQRVLVDLVEIGALLAIDLDVDEQLIHPPRNRGILEALMRHHMAPMAGGVADRQQDRLVGRLGRGQCRLAPGLPVDRVVAVLEEVGARLFAEAVLIHCGSCRADLSGVAGGRRIALVATTG